MLTVGLVIEGYHDLSMLPPMIEAEIRRRQDQEIKFRLLQPQSDETGRVDSGGWQRVLAWCLENAAEKIQTFFTPLFSGDPACDIIIIHVDGDSYSGLMAHHKGESIQPPLSINARITDIIAAFEKWLALEQDVRSKVAFAVPVLKTEAWIVASESVVHDCETMDAKAEFLRGYSKERHGQKANFYRIRAEAAARRRDQIARQCFSYRFFASEIEALVLPA